MYWARYIQYVQEVVTHFIQLASYIKWVTTSWTYSSFSFIFWKTLNQPVSTWLDGKRFFAHLITLKIQESLIKNINSHVN